MYEIFYTIIDQINMILLQWPRLEAPQPTDNTGPKVFMFFVVVMLIVIKIWEHHRDTNSDRFLIALKDIEKDVVFADKINSDEGSPKDILFSVKRTRRSNGNIDVLMKLHPTRYEWECLVAEVKKGWYPNEKTWKAKAAFIEPSKNGLVIKNYLPEYAEPKIQETKDKYISHFADVFNKNTLYGDGEEVTIEGKKSFKTVIEK